MFRGEQLVMSAGEITRLPRTSEPNPRPVVRRSTENGVTPSAVVLGRATARRIRVDAWHGNRRGSAGTRPPGLRMHDV